MTRRLRVAFLGNDRWSVASLEALAGSDHPVVAVITSIPKAAGRGNRLTATPVAEAARSAGLAVHEVETVRSGPGFEALAASAPEILAVVAYGEILPPEVLGLPAVAPVNLHFSLLPRLRGASPVQTALRQGLGRTGVTTIVMDRGLDTGPVILQREVPIDPADDAASLGGRLAVVGASVLVETIELLATGIATPHPQDEAFATFTTRLGPDDGVLDWTEPATDLVNLCRAMSPDPGATTTFRGEVLKVFRSEVVPAAGEAGTVVETSKGAFVVATGRDGVRPLELAPAGRRHMPVADFVNGYRPVLGERLG